MNNYDNRSWLKNSSMLHSLHFNLTFQLFWKLRKHLLKYFQLFYLVFAGNKKNLLHLTPLSINNVLLNRITQIRYLGILIDEHPNWSKHISHVQSLISKNIGIIARMRPFINTEIALLSYFSLVYP